MTPAPDAGEAGDYAGYAEGDATQTMPYTGNLSGYLDMLDSHVVNAAVKQRLSPEEKLAKEVARRRKAEAERRSRIFNAKLRNIGLDVETLDKQVAEKQEKAQREKELEKATNQDIGKVNKSLQLLEGERRRSQFEAEKQCKEYNLQHLTFDKRREFDLNDPSAMRKDLPARLGDDDPRCGPASLQKFNGEDLLLEERQAQQKVFMRSVLEQQMFEKSMLATEHAGDDAAWQAEVGEITQMRNDIEERETALRGEMRKGQQQENLAKGHERYMKRVEEMQMNGQLNAAEIEHHSKDTFLNENAGHFLEGGRIRRDAYKGSTRDDRERVKDSLLSQAEEQKAARAAAASDEVAMAREAEKTRKNLLTMEREKFRMRRHAMEQMAQENKKVQAAHEANRKAVEDSYKNEFHPSFFEQFGSSAR